jgi:hypothetical protein
MISTIVRSSLALITTHQSNKINSNRVATLFVCCLLLARRVRELLVFAMSTTPAPKTRCRFAANMGSQICYGILACISINEACLLSLDARAIAKACFKGGR